jgi:hypothetical protein
MEDDRFEAENLARSDGGIDLVRVIWPVVISLSYTSLEPVVRLQSLLSLTFAIFPGPCRWSSPRRIRSPGLEAVQAVRMQNQQRNPGYYGPVLI